MKTKIIILFLLVATSFANAQKTEKRMVQLSDASIDAAHGDFKTKIGLTYLVNKKNGWTNRYSISLLNSNIDQSPLFYSTSGVSFRSYNSIGKSLQINIGKEFRIPIHKSI